MIQGYQLHYFSQYRELTLRENRLLSGFQLLSCVKNILCGAVGFWELIMPLYAN